MRILFISHFLPWPPTIGATQRTFHLLKALAQRHEVTLIALDQKSISGTDENRSRSIAVLRSMVHRFHFFDIPSDATLQKRALLIIRNLFSKRPLIAERFNVEQAGDAIRRICGERSFDCVHFDTVGLMELSAHIPASIPLVLNHHNMESLLLTRRARAQRGIFQRTYMHLQAKRLAAYELGLIGKVNLNIAVSAEDAVLLRNCSLLAKVEIVPNGTDTEYFSPATHAPRRSIVFAGGLGWHPNLDSMLYFCSEIYPRINAAVPEITFDLLGPRPPRELISAAAPFPCINVRGFVDDVRPYIHAASVYVVPLRVGGGTRLKILDALAMGKAVVSTSIGAEGLELVPGRDIVIADTPDEFAAAVIALLNHATRCRALGRSGRRVVERLYAWTVVGPNICRIYEEHFST